jgi:D-glycero-D-manno-heptose 1,7-bisphosphate phosphatase
LEAVFLDRDGTINVKAPEGSYISSAAQLRLLPRAGEAVRALNDAGVLVLVLTNQQGVACERMTLNDVERVNEALTERLGRSGARTDGFYVCPHANGSCGCRKPKPGLFFQARRDYPDLCFEHTVMIGDSETDVQAASAAGARAIRLGHDGTVSAASQLFPDLVSAVKALLGSLPERSDAQQFSKPIESAEFRRG